MKKLNTKVNNLENKIPDPHKININKEQVNKVGEKNGYLHKKIPDVSGLVTNIYYFW